MSSFDTVNLNDVTPEDLALYLNAMGWESRTVENPNIAAFGFPGEGAEVTVPVNPTFRDYDIQLQYVFRTLVEVERRDLASIVRDVLSTWADIVRVRISPPSIFQRNTVNLSDGVALIDESYKMLTAAARSTENPRPVYYGGVTGPILDYLKRTQLGHTEKGSFVVKIFSPTAPSSHERHATEDESFARRVTRTLHNSLEGIRSAAQPQSRALTTIFEELIPTGVSANLCDALAQIAEVSNDRAVDVNFTWSWRNPVEAQASATTVVPAMIISALGNMSKHLRSMDPEPEFQLKGTVTKLSNIEKTGDFGLGIEAQVDGSRRKVAIELTGSAREVASLAWKTGATVLCIGTLDRRRSPYRLLPPIRFELIEEIGGLPGRRPLRAGSDDDTLFSD